LADSNLNTSISALVTQLVSETPTANVDELVKITRAAEVIGQSEHANLETALNTRVNALVSTASVDELSKLARSISAMKEPQVQSTSVDMSALSQDIVPANNNGIDIGHSTRYIDDIYANNIIINTGTIAGTPTNATDIVNKSYVDSASSTIGADILPDTNATYDIGSSSATFVNIHAAAVKGLSAPVSNTDAANKEYVDNATGGTNTVSSINGITGTVTINTDDIDEGIFNHYYTDARVDTHLNQSAATSNQVLSWNGTDYAWVDQSGGIDIDGGDTLANGDFLLYDSSNSHFGFVNFQSEVQAYVTAGTNNINVQQLTDVDSVDTLASGDILLHDGSEFKFVNFASEVNTYADARIATTNIQGLSDVNSGDTIANGDVLLYDSGNSHFGFVNLGSEITGYLSTYATQGYVNTQIANLVDSAPSTLDTLNELAAALGDDPNFATTITNSIANKLPLAGGTMSGDIDGNGNKVLFANMYATTGDLPSATTYHGMFAHVHATGKGYFAHGGSWIELASETWVAQQITAAGSYSDASVDTHLNRSTATSGQVLSWNGTDYDWIDASSGGASIEVSATAPSSPSSGDMWFDSTSGNTYIYYTDADSSQWIQINGTGTIVQNITNNNTVFGNPTITSVSPNSFDGSSGTVITIQGTNFDVGTVVSFIDSNGVETNASATSIVTQGELTATIPQAYTESEGPLDVKVTVGDGQNVTTTDAIQTGGSPTWVTASGQIGGSLYKDQTGVSLQIEATDPDGQFVSYEVASGSLAPGLSLAAGTGLITGDITTSSITANTNYSFTANANDTAGNSTPRTFFINVLNSGQQVYYTYKISWGGAASGGDWGHDYGRSPTGSYISGDAYISDMTIPWGGTTNPHSVWGSGSAVNVSSLYDSNWGTSGSFDIGVYVHSGSYSGRATGTSYMDTITFSSRDISGGVHRLQSGNSAKLTNPNEHFNVLQGDTVYVTVRLT